MNLGISNLYNVCDLKLKDVPQTSLSNVFLTVIVRIQYKVRNYVSFICLNDKLILR